MNKRHYEHTLPNIRGSLSNTYILSTIKLLLNTIDYQIIIFSINFTTKFEEESKNPIVAPCMKKEL